MTPTELIERYVHEVGKRLPRKTTADIQMELKSLLLDTLDQRASDIGQEPSLKMTSAMLQEFGKPEEMARQYQPEQYLIGPTLFPIFKDVLAIVLTVIAVFHLLGVLGIVWGQGGSLESIGSLLWDVATNYIRVTIVNTGIVLLIFAIIERVQTNPKADQQPAEPEWDPMTLSPVEDPNQIKTFEMIAGIIAAAIFIILFNIFGEWIGLGNSNSDTVIYPLFAADFRVHIPWLTTSWILDILLKLTVLRQGSWQTPTRWFEFGIGLLDIVITYRLIVGGTLLTISILDTMARYSLRVVLFFLIIEAFSRLYRLLFKRPLPSFPYFKSRTA